MSLNVHEQEVRSHPDLAGQQDLCDEQIIVTAASRSYEKSLLAFLGSLNCNWPGHPRVVVYDLGMSQPVLDHIRQASIELRQVPEFCPHWRTDFTWKVWCCRDAPGRSYLWLDAGICVLRPMDEIFRCIDHLGYFAVALYNHPVGPSVPEPLRRNLGLAKEEMDRMISISAGIHGFRKAGLGAKLIEEAYERSLTHDNIHATAPPHRHDQALLTLLLYKYFGDPILAEYYIYAHHDPSGPGAESRQKLWVHRNKMTDADKNHLAQYVGRPGPAYRPVDRIQSEPPPGLLKKLRIAVAKVRGRYPGDSRVDLNKTVLHGVKD